MGGGEAGVGWWSGLNWKPDSLFAETYCSSSASEDKISCERFW